jgi:hypothetical protein
MMNSGLNQKRSSNCNAVDMSSSAISSRLREVSELHQLGLSLANAKPMVNLPQSVDKTESKRCPKCDRIARTPEAKQCLWCGHNWH